MYKHPVLESLLEFKMSEKKEIGKRPPTRPSIKVSIPIAVYLKRREKLRRAALLAKQQMHIDKMKVNHKSSEITSPEAQNNVMADDPTPNISDVRVYEQRPAPDQDLAIPEPENVGQNLPCEVVKCQAPPARVPHRLDPRIYRRRPDDNNNIF